MEKITNWPKLWQELSDLNEAAFAKKTGGGDGDAWKGRARKFDNGCAAKGGKTTPKPSSIEERLVALLSHAQGDTLLDVGAGTGKWSILLAPYLKTLTALEPSMAMQEVLKENIETHGVDNIDILTATWPAHPTPQHDYVLASHSMYGIGDFVGFVEKMNATAQKGCFIVIRAPFPGSILSEAAMHIWGQPYDSPNFQVAYNILLGMGIFAHVEMETKRSWKPKYNDSIEDALHTLKQKLGVDDTERYDAFLTTLLEKHLVYKENQYAWPDGTGSALLYWNVS